MPRWFLLPGMGATSAMYDSLRGKIDFEIEFIDWPVWRGEATCADVARRVREERGIADGDVVGGSSLGGMVALELAKILRPSGVVLLGSAVHPREIQGLLSALSPLAALTPVSWIQLVAGKRNSPAARMFSDADPDFVRAMCLHLSSWPGHPGPVDGLFRLHGRRDLVIPCPTGGVESVEIVEGAGHLLAMTHPKECANFFRRARERMGA